MKKIILSCFCLISICRFFWAQENSVTKTVGPLLCTLSVASGDYYIEETGDGDGKIWHSGISDFSVSKAVFEMQPQGHDISGSFSHSIAFERFSDDDKTEYKVAGEYSASVGTSSGMSTSSGDIYVVFDCPYDPDAPVCSITNESGDCRISGSSIYCSGTTAEFSYTFTDEGCGLKSVKKLIDSGYQDCSASGSLSICAGDENHTFCFMACDKLGNETAVNYTVYFDSAAPGINIIQGAISSGGYGYAGETTIGVCAADADSGINSDTFRIIKNGTAYYIKPDDSGVLISEDGMSWKSSDEYSLESIGTNFYLTFNKTGVYSVSFSIQDNAGNTAQTETENIEILDSNLEISVEPSGAYNADDYFSSMTFIASAATSKGIDLASWQYSLDGGTNWCTASTDAYSVTVDSGGTYKVVFRIRNSAGKIFTSAIYPVKIDNSAPVMELTDDGADTYTENEWCENNVCILISDGTSGINRQSLKINCSTADVTVQETDGNQYVCIIKDEGRHSVSIKVSDNAGNSAQRFFSVCIDKEPVRAEDISYSGTFSSGTDSYRALTGSLSGGSALDGNIQKIAVSVKEQESGCQAESVDCCAAAGILTESEIKNRTYTKAYEWNGTGFPDEEGSRTAEINVSAVKDGTYTLVFYIKDTGGKISVNSRNISVVRNAMKPDSSWFDVSFDGTELVCKPSSSVPAGITVCQYVSKAASGSGMLPAVVTGSIPVSKSEKIEGLYEAYVAAVDVYGNHSSADFYVLYNADADTASAFILAAKNDDIIININSQEKNSLKPLEFSDTVNGEKQNIRSVSVYVVNENTFEYEFITNQAVIWKVYSDWFAEQNSNSQYVTDMSGTISFGGNEEGKIYPVHIDMITQDNETKSKVIYVRYNKAPVITTTEGLFVVNPGHSKKINELVSVTDGDENIPGDYPLTFIWDPCSGTEAVSWTGGTGSTEVLGDGAEKSVCFVQSSEKAQTSDYTGKLTVTDRYGKSSSSDIKIRVVNTQSGMLLVNEYWTDTHQLTGTVVVPADLQLTLDGCTVTVGGIMNDAKKIYAGGITVEKGGTLLAAGSAPSVLQSDDSSVKWYGLKIAGTFDGSAVQVSNAERGISMLPGSLVHLEKMNISGCTTGIHMLGGTLKIQDAEITHNKEYGIKCEDTSVPDIKNPVLENNGENYYLNGIIIK
jgi:hypothetical protein